MLLDTLSSKPTAFLYYLRICPFGKLTNAILKFIHENGSMNSVLFWDVLYCWISDSLTREMATKENKRNIYVNWIFLMFLKCPTHGMSPPSYLSYLSAWWEVDPTHVITCKILVVANDSTTITPSTSCLHTRFPGNLIPASFPGFRSI